MHSEGPPLLFETMVFSDDPDSPHHGGGAMWRTSTWDEAMEQHERVCDMLRFGEEYDSHGGDMFWAAHSRDITSKKGTVFTDDEVKLIYKVCMEVARKNDGNILLDSLIEHPNLQSFFENVEDKKLRAFGMVTAIHVTDRPPESEYGTDEMGF
jgi:hypothetical protein